jgi:long-subunit acyl-CoA synthetase (AMP-forming)
MICTRSFIHQEAQECQKVFFILSDPGIMLSQTVDLISTIPWFRYEREKHYCFFITPFFQVSFTPLAHSSGRRFVWQCLSSGGRTFFVNEEMYGEEEGKLDYLLKECQLVEPVIMSSTPRLWNALYSIYCSKMEEKKVKYPQKLAQEIKKESLMECKSILGTRLRFVTIGGGASSPEIQNWMFECFQCIVNNGYGATESGLLYCLSCSASYCCSVLFNIFFLLSFSFDCVGGIASGGVGSAMRFAPKTQWKLRSVPELGNTCIFLLFELLILFQKGYDANGTPPRGELLVKTPSMAIGYLNQPDQTRKAWIDDFYCTGDIVEVDEKNQVRIIDRAKNFVKLAQGEFVTAEHLESLFSSCKSIFQICVHADSLQR